MKQPKTDIGVYFHRSYSNGSVPDVSRPSNAMKAFYSLTIKSVLQASTAYVMSHYSIYWLRMLLQNIEENWIMMAEQSSRPHCHFISCQFKLLLEKISKKRRMILNINWLTDGRIVYDLVLYSKSRVPKKKIRVLCFVIGAILGLRLVCT